MEVDIKGASIGALAQCPNLVYLHLFHNDTTDGDLPDVAKLTHLNELKLSRVAITDAGLPHLYGMKNLRVLMLVSCDVSREGVTALQKELPDCKIHFVEK